MRLRHPDGRRLVLKDPVWVRKMLKEGYAEEPRKISPYEIPHGSLHECCLCDVTYRQGIDGLRCPHVRDGRSKE